MSAMPGAGTLDAMPFADAVDQATGFRHRLGATAIIQTRAALDEQVGVAARRAIFEACGPGVLDDLDPDGMVEARVINALNYEIGAQLGPEAAHAVMKRAGELAGDAFLADRIAKPLQWLLKALPRGLAQRLLMTVIARNAVVFAGQAHIETGSDFISVHDNPICLSQVGYSSCIWHAALFHRVFTILVDPRITIHETECVGWGSEMCKFEIVRV